MNHFTEFLPYGVQYYRAPTPLPEEWEEDLAELARLGYTHIQLRPQWRWHERIRGQYKWEDLDVLFDLAAKYNLRVVLKPMMETAPDWVFTELNGTRKGFHGKTLDPIAHAAYYVGGWWPCFDNPEVAKATAEFVTALVNRYKEHEALWFYNAWNEPRSRPMGQCTCDHSVRKYRDFLRREYGTIENLNKTFGKAWTSFDTVFPPHSPSDYVELFLWRRWAGESVADQIGIVSEAIYKADPNAKVMCHTGHPSVCQDIACDTCNDMLNIKKVDWYGTSLWINLTPENPVHFNMPFFQLAWMRKVDNEYWCHEFYPNKGPWWRQAKPAFVEQAILMTIAAGCKGFTFWQYKSERFGEESDGYGMRNIDGSETPRSKRCDKIAELMIRLGSDFARSEVLDSPVAVYYDDKNDLLMRIEEMNCPLTGIEEVKEEHYYSYKCALQGAHSYLRRLGYTADYVILGEDMSQYKVVVFSCQEMTDETMAQKLITFVENGGTLLVEYPFACRDNKTWVSPKRPNSGLEVLTGCREYNRVEFSEDAEDEIFFVDHSEKTSGWHVYLDVIAEDAKVIGRWEDGLPAVVERKVGRGHVITSAGNFAMRIKTEPAGDIPYIYKEALKTAGLDAVESSLWSRSRYSDDYEYRFYFNTAEQPESVVVEGELVYASEECEVKESVITLPLYGVVVFKIRR